MRPWKSFEHYWSMNDESACHGGRRSFSTRCIHGDGSRAVWPSDLAATGARDLAAARTRDLAATGSGSRFSKISDGRVPGGGFAGAGNTCLSSPNHHVSTGAANVHAKSPHSWWLGLAIALQLAACGVLGDDFASRNHRNFINNSAGRRLIATSRYSPGILATPRNLSRPSRTTPSDLGRHHLAGWRWSMTCLPRAMFETAATSPTPAQSIRPADRQSTPSD